MRWKKVATAATLPGLVVLAPSLAFIPDRLAPLVALLVKLAASLTLGFAHLRDMGSPSARPRWKYLPRPTEAGQ